MSAFRNPSTLLCAVALSSFACTNTSTGNPLNNGPGTGGEAADHDGHCEERGAVTLELDEQSTLGFSAADMLALADNAQDQTLNWHALSNVSVGPESGEQALTLEITSRGQARLVDYERKANGFEIGGECPDRLEVPVTLKLRSAQGALDESIETTLSARSAHVARIYHRLPADKIAGSLEVEAQDGFKLNSLTVALSLTSFGGSGEITPMLEKSSGDTASAAPSRPLASWGQSGCENLTIPVPAEAAVADFSGVDVLALLKANPSTPAAIKAEQFETTLTFVPDSDGFCAMVEPSVFAPPGANSEVGTLRVGGTLHVRTESDAFEAHIRGTLAARPKADGSLESVAFEGERANVVGFSGVDVTAYDQHVLRAYLELAAQGTWTGDITLVAYELPDCSTEATENGSPGCEGATPHELASLNPTH